MSVIRDYESYVEKYNIVWDYLKKSSRPHSEVVSEVCEYRKYFGGEKSWGDFLKNKMVCVTESCCDFSLMRKDEFKELALFTETGRFLLEGRYIVPVTDMLGNVVALIGWYPDDKRYITTPSKYFSKECMYFGMEQLGKRGLNKPFFIVEGIFDSLNIRRLGFNAMANMGVSSSRVKKKMYGLFSKLIFISDNDETGRKVLKEDRWSTPSTSTFFSWSGTFDFGDGVEAGIKDVDLLCSLFEEDDLKNILQECVDSKDSLITLKL